VTGPRGHLVLVVGPSGAGKDTLLHKAHEQYADDRAYYFPRRFITRPADAGGEPHISITRREFDKKRNAGQFSLWWDANGHCYGIPADVEEAQRQGVTVVVNVSRTVIDLARESHAPVLVILVTARPDVLASRLAQRGRESVGEIENRLRRAARYLPSGDDVCPVDNSGALAHAVDAFTTILRYARTGLPGPEKRVAS